MTIDLNEHLLTLADAAKTLPTRNGKRLHVSTLHRWATAGVRGVVLETAQLGGVTMTSREAITRFMRDLTVKSGKGATAAKRRTPSSRTAQAKKALEAAGIR